MNSREKNIINCQNIMQLNVNKIAANVINSLMQKCCLVYLYWIGRILTSVTLQKLRYNYLIAYKNPFVRQLNCLMRSGLDGGKTFLVYSFWHLSPVNYEICGIFSFSVYFTVCLSVSHLISLDSGLRTPNPRGIHSHDNLLHSVTIIACVFHDFWHNVNDIKYLNWRVDAKNKCKTCNSNACLQSNYEMQHMYAHV